MFTNIKDSSLFIGLFALVMCLCIKPYAQGPSLNIGDSLCSFFWTQSATDKTNKGYYGITNITNKTLGNNTTVLQAKLNVLKLSWLQHLLARTTSDITLNFSNSKPDSIERCSSRFDSIPWLRSINEINSATNYQMRFYFPVLPTSKSYSLYDYFTVLVDNLMALEFQVISDSTMIGSFINNRKTGNGKTIIYAKDAIAIQLTNKNALRIRSVQVNGTFDSLVSSYFRFDLSMLKKDALYYGINFIDTSISIPTIQVKNVALAGTPPFFADSTYKISWSLVNATNIVRCSVFVSLDSGSTWEAAGTTLQGTDSSILWTAPHLQGSDCFIKVVAIGKEGQKSESLSPKFAITLSNAFLLTAASYKSTSVILGWNPSQITILKAKNLCIVYRKDSAITDITTPGIDTIHYDLNISSDTITGLQTGAVYHFTAFVLDSLGAFHSPGGQSTAWALVKDVTPPENTYLLRGNILTASSIVLRWGPGAVNDTTIDSIGIRYSKLNFPTSIVDTLSNLIGKYTTADTCDTVLNLQKNQAYYFSLFVANASGVWSGSTQNSRIYMQTDSSNGQGIILGIDTQHILNDSILLWTIPKLQTPFSDTVYLWNGPAVKKGFVQTGLGFLLRKGILPAGTILGIKITYRMITSPLKAIDQRVYRYNVITGGWRLADEPVFIDTIKHTITTTSKDAGLPYIVMIDTAKPVVDKHLNTQKVFSVNQRITDTFSVTDNIENVALHLFASPGSREYSDISLYITNLPNTSQYLTTLPPNLADIQSGLRGIFLANDGNYTDTTNLSRKILRDSINCDDTAALAMQWTPLLVTAQPETISVLSVISEASPPQPYNQKTERILQWLPGANNSSEVNKWVEYDPSLDSLFSVVPGKLFWIKSKDDRKIHYGKATIPSVQDTFSVCLNKNGWTDFSIPYRYNMYLGDILDATKRIIGNVIDSIGLYRWEKTQTSYETEPVYLPGIKFVDNPTDTIQGAVGYSAYNSTANSLSLVIPPTCLGLSSIQPSEKLPNSYTSSDWCVKINVLVNNNDLQTPIYCASKNNIFSGYYPLPPTFSLVKTGIFDDATNCLYGHAVTGDLGLGGYRFNIICENNASQSNPVMLFVEKKEGIPAGMAAGLFYGENDKLCDSLEISLEPYQKRDLHLIIGTPEYVNDIFLQLTSKLYFKAIPIAFSRSIKIIYTLPYKTRMVQFTMFDLKGRKIQLKNIGTGRILATTGTVSFSGSFAAGLYIMEMRATVEGNNNPQIKRQRVIYVK